MCSVELFHHTQGKLKLPIILKLENGPDSLTVSSLVLHFSLRKLYIIHDVCICNTRKQFIIIIANYRLFEPLNESSESTAEGAI